MNTNEALKILWQAMSDEDKKEVREIACERFTKDMLEIYQMYNDGKLNSTMVKKLFKDLTSERVYWGVALGVFE